MAWYISYNEETGKRGRPVRVTSNPIADENEAKHLARSMAVTEGFRKVELSNIPPKRKLSAVK